MSSWLYSPSKNTEHGIILFSSFKIDFTKKATEAPGAYQADVPKSLVSVAPPTIVLAETFSNSSSEIKSEIGKPL